MATRTPGTSSSDTATPPASSPSTLDCLLHPIDCASGAFDSAAASVSSSAAGVVASSTAPLHEVANTAMWTAIGVAAAAVAVIAIAIVAVYAFHRI